MSQPSKGQKWTRSPSSRRMKRSQGIPAWVDLAACQKGLATGFITASALVHALLEARDDKQLLRLQKQLAKYKLLIID
ncbi:MAG: ATP-binding protein, partial [Hyphomicrobiales bacterium]|nr:ATP-binding protein [Hyphomicrobiales bacterium]